jgi:hypothetical protein
MGDQPFAETATYTKQSKQETNIHDLSGIGTRETSNQAAADLRLRPHASKIYFLPQFWNTTEVRF